MSLKYRTDERMKMKTIEMQDLKAVVNRLNEITDNATEAWTVKNGVFTANVGNYHIESGYGGHKLVQLVDEKGGIREITYEFSTKRELYNLIHAYMNGICEKLK